MVEEVTKEKQKKGEKKNYRPGKEEARHHRVARRGSKKKQFKYNRKIV
jgi:hypothetical protein